MAKKKKKDKKKADEEISSYTLDSALKSSKKTESALQGLLKAFSEDTGYVESKEKKTKIEPQLTYEAKKKIAQDYMMEQVPLSERGKLKEKEAPSKTEKEEELPSVSKKGKDIIYPKLMEFVEYLFEGYGERYEMWENSVSSILAIIRKMRKITKKNTEDLVNSINKLHEKIQFNLEQFKIKRDQVEKLTDVDVESMSSEFKKVLGLLELQVKEYQLKKLADEYIHQQKTI